MELINYLQEISQKTYTAMQPTDLLIGTVVSASPLEISINTAMANLKSQVLYLTSAVIPKTLTSLAHTHTTSGLAHTHTVPGDETTGEALTGEYPGSEELSGVVCTENGVPLPNSGSITINRGLAVGDKVLLLRVQSGQKFVVLSRLFGGG